jgi:S-formylglutathione hydrolase FrmB
MSLWADSGNLIPPLSRRKCWPNAVRHRPTSSAHRLQCLYSMISPSRQRVASFASNRRLLAIGATGILLAAIARSSFAADTIAFGLTLDPSVSQQPLTGRLFVFLERGEGLHPNHDPRLGPNWFSPEPFFGIDVQNMSPGATRIIDDTADGFPGKLSDVPPGRYRAQAILDHNLDYQHHGNAPGNIYSDVVIVEIDPAAPHSVPLTLNHVAEPLPWPKSRWVEEVSFESKLLSAFHHRQFIDRCAVALPASYYDQPERRYPVVFVIPGFGGSHRDGLRYAERPAETNPGEAEFIRVYLSGQCKWGHHVYADSATNGPRGQSLIDELIPEIDRRYRTIPKRDARFLFGHSSGGWSSLWLMVNYPETFGGVWSNSPDPVDFRDWQGTDLYADPPLSVFTNESGGRRPLARRGDQVQLYYEGFSHMDDVIKRGGQLRSFEAVFSPLDADGQPKRLWDRQTGRVDPDVAKTWQKYDIRLLIERDWKHLQPLLAGRVHITMGGQDTFYLDGAVRLLQDSLRQLGSDAEVTILFGRGHTDYVNAVFLQSVRHQMSDLFLRLNADSANSDNNAR